MLVTYQTISTVAGLLFSIALVFFAKKITATRFNFWIFTLLIMISANTVLFYGYVENYSMTTAIIGMSILSALASLRNGKKSLIPIAGFACAVFLHTVCLVYLPAFLLYIGLTFGGSRIRQFLNRKSGIILLTLITVLIVGYGLVRIWAPPFWRMAFLPPLGDQFTTDNYFLLSPSHFLDYANLLFFLIPVTMVVLILKIRSRHWLVFRNSKPEYLFLSVAAAIGLLSAFIIEPKLGMAKDWDLMSTMLIGGSIFGIYYWVDRFGEQKYFKPTSLILVILCVSIYLPWLVLNNSIDAVRNYSISVMKLDPKHCRPGLQTMGAYLEKEGRIAEAQKMARYCNMNYPELKMRREGSVFFGQGQYSKAESIFKLALKKNPSWANLYSNLGLCQLEMGNYPQALENLIIADGLNPYNVYTYNYLGEAYFYLGETSLALDYWHKSIDGGGTVLDAYLSISLFHLNGKQPDSAMYYLSEIPDNEVTLEVYYWRGLAAYSLNDIPEMDENFDAYLRLGIDSTNIYNIKRIRKSLLNGNSAPESKN